MSNAFYSAKKIEMESRNILHPLLEEASNGRVIYTDKGPLAKEFQKRYCDVLIQEKKANGMWTIEIKAERKRSANLFLEMWSNGSRFTPGWMFHCEADLLFYHFLDSDELYIVKLQNLRRWFWFGIGPERRNGTSTIYEPGYKRFNLKRQALYEQMNDTWGVCVPTGSIMNEVGIRLLNPLGLFGMSEVAWL